MPASRYVGWRTPAAAAWNAGAVDKQPAPLEGEISDSLFHRRAGIRKKMQRKGLPCPSGDCDVAQGGRGTEDQLRGLNIETYRFQIDRRRWGGIPLRSGLSI